MKNIRKLLFSKSKGKIDWDQSIARFIDEYEDLSTALMIILVCCVGAFLVWLMTLVPDNAWPIILTVLGVSAVIGFIWMIIHKFRKVMVRKTNNSNHENR